MEFRITITITELGRSEEDMERFLEGFRRTHPETGPVVSGSEETGELSVTFALDAHDAREADERGAVIFADGGKASGVASASDAEIVGIRVEAVTGDEVETELQPA